MREVQSLGGPAPGYQSEVETGKKVDVHPRTLGPWVEVLGVTVPFAEGALPTGTGNPSALRHLALQLEPAIREAVLDDPAWTTTRLDMRVRLVLRTIAGRSKALPPLVLAHVLGAGLSELESVLEGTHSVPAEWAQIAAYLIDIPVSDLIPLQSGGQDPDAHMAARLAAKLGATSEEMETLLLGFLPILRIARARRLSIREVQDQFFSWIA